MKNYFFSLFAIVCSSTCLAQSISITISNAGTITNRSTTTHSTSQQSPASATQAHFEKMFTHPLRIISSNMFITGLVIAGSSYCGYNVWQLYKARALLKNKKNWCMWKHEVPVQALNEIPDTQLLAELRKDIATDYDSCQYPLLTCLKDLHYEHQQLLHALNICNALTSIGVMENVLCANAMTQSCKEALARLELIYTTLNNSALYA